MDFSQLMLDKKLDAILESGEAKRQDETILRATTIYPNQKIIFLMSSRQWVTVLSEFRKQ